MLFKKLKAIRGAINSENNSDKIEKTVIELYSKILKENKLSEKNIVSIQFTMTKDLTAKNPASALRKNGYAQNIPLFCAVEPDIVGALPNTIRVLIFCYTLKQVKHIYLGNAQSLRPDLKL